MKKLLLISSLFSVAICNAQFWTENFGTGCSSANPASGYAGANGTWTVTNTGTNDSYADVWYVSAKCNNTGAGNCATGCSNTNSRTLHIGNADLAAFGVGPDSTATYLTGVFCSSFSVCSTTHKRVDSPVINCTGHSGISISFIYLEGGEASDDDATLWYSDGITWTQIDPLAKTTVCASTSGIWTSFTMNLPASADNNANVKIGFQWTNDNDAQGTDPSFAVDDITLSTLVSGFGGEQMPEECSAYCDGGNIIIRSPGTFKVLSVMNVLGESIPFSSNGNAVKLKENTEGIYFLKIEVGKKLVTRKVQMLR